MKTHPYCYARCNRAKRRICSKDCRSDVVETSVDRSLLDIQTFYGAARKTEPNHYWPSVEKVLRQDEELSRGRDVMKLWLVALGDNGHTEVPPSWRIDGVRYMYWDPRILFRDWKDDVRWFYEQKDKAIERGLDSMLDAYYSGVPVADIIA